MSTNTETVTRATAAVQLILPRHLVELIPTDAPAYTGG